MKNLFQLGIYKKVLAIMDEFHVPGCGFRVACCMLQVAGYSLGYPSTVFAR